MVKIHPIQTGQVQIKTSQRRRKTGGLIRVLLDRSWTEWLPIYAWAIEHPEGIIVVDTGDTARTSERDYFPRWHPYYRTSVRLDVSREQEIGPQLEDIGISPTDVRTVILTHFHTDHAGGLSHFPESEILVQGDEFASAQGLMGKLQGYLPHRWPDWIAPTPIPFEGAAVGPFEQSYSATQAGDVLIVPTPGHTPGHISVIVKADGVNYFLAGDTSYTQKLLLEREPDGVSPKRATAMRTIDLILEYAQSEPTVYLPSHDPQSAERLERQQELIVAA
jgi:glyoxylase-like metal-dependent hydrolase (beta-lactamase superfamily II)